MGTDATVVHVFKNRFSLHHVHKMASDILQHSFNTGPKGKFSNDLDLERLSVASLIGSHYFQRRNANNSLLRKCVL
jgi:hypothetical protein